MNPIKKTTCLLVSTFLCAHVLKANLQSLLARNIRAQLHHVHLMRFIDYRATAHPVELSMKCNLCQNSIYTKHYCNSDLLCAKHDSTLSSFQLQFL